MGFSRPRPRPRPRLVPIELPAGLFEHPIPGQIERLLEESERRTQVFHDRLAATAVEQFVASDHRLVYRTLAWIEAARLLSGRRFIEWGCGFAVNACAAASLGWDVIAVEAQAALLPEARQIIALWQQPVELLQANFLPAGAEQHSDDPYLPSLGHAAESVYTLLDMSLDDFDIVFAYPWPGEGDFIEEVFAMHAAAGAVLVCFRGPYEIAVLQKRLR